MAQFKKNHKQQLSYIHPLKKVFSRSKKTPEEKPTPPISAPIGPPTIGTGTQLGSVTGTLNKDKNKDDKKGFARLASFSRKKKTQNENKSSTEDIGTFLKYFRH